MPTIYGVYRTEDDGSKTLIAARDTPSGARSAAIREAAFIVADQRPRLKAVLLSLVGADMPMEDAADIEDVREVNRVFTARMTIEALG